MLTDEEICKRVCPQKRKFMWERCSLLGVCLYLIHAKNVAEAQEQETLKRVTEGLGPCSNCEQWVILEDIELTEDWRKAGFVRATRCPACGDEVAHPPTAREEEVIKETLKRVARMLLSGQTFSLEPLQEGKFPEGW